MKITIAQLRQLIKEEIRGVAGLPGPKGKGAPVNEIFGMGKPQYQQDIADEEEAKKRGYRSAAAMQWDDKDWKQISKCSAFTDGFKYFAEKMGRKDELNVGWFGGVKAPRTKEEMNRYSKLLDDIKGKFPGPSEKWMAEMKNECAKFVADKSSLA